MAVVNVKNSYTELDENGEEVIVLEYDLPNLLDPHPGKSKSLYGGHEHKIPFSAVWARMQAYDITREEAVEECVLAIVEPGLYKHFPVDASKREQARAKHNVASVRNHAGKVRMPTDDEVAKVKRAIGKSPRRFRNAHELISHFTQQQGNNSTIG